ncbi:IS1595 family transposase [Marinobacter gelidimuriae]|uniref:IS1595 family transposase n=1 Tax=Marinobacter gelidimuriae TaxID=2739064 RepID=UPI0015A51AF0|nr:IS1595 family transposase [Marinobacter gelidimuriae]
MTAVIDSLSPCQRHQLLEHLQHPKAIPAIIEHLEQRLQSQLKCPTCNHDKVYRWGILKGLQRYRCRGCTKTFTALTGTPLACLRKRELWMEYATSMLNSEALRTAARRCKIRLDTSFHWRHRFLKLADYLNAKALSGIVEADQTLFCESFKGQRKIIERPVRKRGNDNKKAAKWVPVLVARDRNSSEADFVFKHFTLKNVEQHLLPLLSQDIVLCTDAHLTFESLANKHHLHHKVLNVSAGERVKEAAFHIQGVNNYHQRLKCWIQRFHGVATGRSRNAGHPAPPAQIRTCATNAYGSYLECIPSNRLFGQGCTTLGCGSASRKN